jgi:uncharacterized protein
MSEQTCTNFLARRPLLSFFVLTYAFFWLMLILFGIITGLLRVNTNTLPVWLMPLLTIIGSWMASLSAAIVTGVTEGRGAVRKLFGMFFKFRLPGRWYLAALIPFGLAIVAATLYRVLGGAPSGGVPLTFAFWAGLVGINFFTGATGEEPGWRGFALPRLLRRYTPLKAGLILGVLWSFWHLPLWLTSGLTPPDLFLYILYFNVGIISLTLLMVWIFCRTSYSLVPMVIIHFAFNASAQFISPTGLGIGPLLPLFGLMSGLLLLSALVVWGMGGLSARSAPRATVPAD